MKKIGGLADGSRIRDAHAHEISHMFFGDAFAGSMFNLFATHPPLEERIKLLDPKFDGSFPATEPVMENEDVSGISQLSARSKPDAQASGTIRPLAGASGFDSTQAAALAGLAAGGSRPARPLSTDRDRILRQVGSPQPEHLEHAGRIVAGMPDILLQAVREPYSARAAIFALLLSRDDQPTRERQWQMLGQSIEPPLVKIVQQLSAAIDQIAPENRLPVADMATPALKRLSPAQYAAFRQIVEALTAADGKIDLFEYCLRVVLFGCLDVQFGLRPAPAVRFKSFAQVAPAATVILSALAYAGQSDPADIQRAFQAGAGDALPARGSFRPSSACSPISTPPWANSRRPRRP